MARKRDYKWEYMQQRVRDMHKTKAPWEQFDTEAVYDVAREHGPEVVTEALRLRKEMQKAHEVGDTGKAHRLWMERNPELPDWLFHYHGFFV